MIWQIVLNDIGAESFCQLVTIGAAPLHNLTLGLIVEKTSVYVRSLWRWKMTSLIGAQTETSRRSHVETMSWWTGTLPPFLHFAFPTFFVVIHSTDLLTNACQNTGLNCDSCSFSWTKYNQSKMGSEGTLILIWLMTQVWQTLPHVLSSRKKCRMIKREFESWPFSMCFLR